MRVEVGGLRDSGMSKLQRNYHEAGGAFNNQLALLNL